VTRWILSFALVTLSAFFVTPSLSKGAVIASETCPAPEVTPNPHPLRVAAPKATLSLLVAASQPVREYGLMCRRELAVHSGMIFVFDGTDAPQNFWMKNTLIPLDMVWVRHDGVVTSVAANVPATTVDTDQLDIPQRRGVGAFVIELNAGEAAADGIVAGTKLDLGAVPKGR
jgi:uncharacterized membrane protein (UPF0127 family)